MLLLLFLPLGFTPLLYPIFLVPILPALGFVILHSVKSGIIIPILAPVYLAGIYGIARFADTTKAKLAGPTNKIAKNLAGNIESVIAVLLLSAGFLSSYYLSDYLLSDARLGPLPFSKNFNIEYYRIKPRSLTGHKVYKLIPPESSCLTLPTLFNYLSNQKRLGKFPDLLNASNAWEYIFLDILQMDRDLLKRLKDILEKGDYGVLAYRQDWLLLKRGYDSSQNRRVISDIYSN
jgi:hypothetical protein